MVDEVLDAFNLSPATCRIENIGSGLINRTWKISSGEEAFILQRINEKVFPDPAAIDNNINRIAAFLRIHNPEYVFTPLVKSRHGHTLVQTDDGYFRLFPFVSNAVTLTVADRPSVAYEAARQFGHFTRLLSAFPLDQLHITLPNFHDLALRYRQFETAVNVGNTSRISQSLGLIGQLQAHRTIVDFYDEILQDPAFMRRVTHHDTKISNVLFNSQQQGICVIDLDTIMPGYFISDVGDMMRTYLSAATEEETDLSKVCVRPSFYQAIVSGYSEEMDDELTGSEKRCFLYAGKYMIYMQALRFLTDYLNNDLYYGSKYPEHNLQRATNQLTLLEDLIRQSDACQRITAR